MRSFLSAIMSLALVFGVCGQGNASTARTPFPIPYALEFTEFNGITWLHLGGHPASRRYIIESGARKSCAFQIYKWKCNGSPCAGEELLYLKLSYKDPSMNEDRGIINQYIELDPKIAVGNIFVPRANWSSVTSSGRLTTNVSYDNAENATIFYQEDKFMFSNYTWAKVVTNETHDKIISVSMSHDSDKATPEDDRWTVLECTGPKL